MTVNFTGNVTVGSVTFRSEDVKSRSFETDMTKTPTDFCQEYLRNPDSPFVNSMTNTKVNITFENGDQLTLRNNTDYARISDAIEISNLTGADIDATNNETFNESVKKLDVSI